MAKIQTVGKISEVMGMDWNAPKKMEIVKGLENVIKSMTGTTLAMCSTVALTPKALAASASAVNSCVKGGTNDTFLNLHGSIMNMFSAGVVIVIIFSGAAWAMGHRGKALEVLLGCCCGYILAIHAIDIRDFLSCI